MKEKVGAAKGGKEGDKKSMLSDIEMGESSHASEREKTAAAVRISPVALNGNGAKSGGMIAQSDAVKAGAGILEDDNDEELLAAKPGVGIVVEKEMAKKAPTGVIENGANGHGCEVQSGEQKKRGPSWARPGGAAAAVGAAWASASSSATRTPVKTSPTDSTQRTASGVTSAATGEILPQLHASSKCEQLLRQ